MPKCIIEGCNNFANPATETGLCNKHFSEKTGISIAEASAVGQRLATPARAAREAERKALLRESSGWWEEMRPRQPLESQTLLGLGVHPAEKKVFKHPGFFKIPNVFLLDMTPQVPDPGLDYSRYVELDWSKDGALERLATRLGGRFDQVAFDWSTMCAFRDGGPNTTSKFNALYKMLKPNGILFLSESDPGYLISLRNAGFADTREVPVEALGGTLVELLGFRERGLATLIVGIKREGGGGGGAAAQAPAPGADGPIAEQLRILLEIIIKGKHNIGGKRSRRKTRRRKLRK
jgi:hypothetical protein